MVLSSRLKRRIANLEAQLEEEKKRNDEDLKRIQTPTT
ncbi:uncharacterized protein G2W53_033863 [Senna tora]|uniref:Uncharacterized protein n=1 Tax=Senna tora TaxID=362788 RepID=A0A834W8E2_9FABA|nr:uncharacterized protein G2W53_033863 [Senna tora]